MLGLAYRTAMQQISEQLSEILETNDLTRLDKLYTDAATFNARFYFNQPVAFGNYATIKAWEDINESLKLKEQNIESVKQITQVHQILAYRQDKDDYLLEKQQIEQDKIQAQKMAAMNKKLTIFGLIISAFGLIAAIDTIIKWLQ